jgi:hypothetical protein
VTGGDNRSDAVCGRRIGSVIFFGLASSRSQDVDEWTLDLAEAHAQLETVLREAPELAGQVCVLEVDFDVPAPLSMN